MYVWVLGLRVYRVLGYCPEHGEPTAKERGQFNGVWDYRSAYGGPGVICSHLVIVENFRK